MGIIAVFDRKKSTKPPIIIRGSLESQNQPPTTIQHQFLRPATTLQQERNECIRSNG